MDQEIAGGLVRRAGKGDERAWTELVSGLRPLLCSVARSFRLDEATVDDVVQTAWLRLCEQIGALRQPEQVVSWLLTTVRHECLRQLRASRREGTVAELDDATLGQADPADQEVVRWDEARTLHLALRSLSDRQRQVMALLVFRPELRYDEIGRALAMPVGSIGPTRGRAIVQLRQLIQSAA